MKAKTVNAIICKKFDSFVSSIKDPEVARLVKDNSIVTGGCIVSLLLGDKVNDFDFYFRNEETTFAVAKYYAAAYVAANPNWQVEAKNNEGRITFSVYSSKNVSTAGEAPKSEEETSVEESMRAFEDADDIPAEALDSAEGEKIQGAQYAPVFLSSNAISLSSKVQLIIRFYGEPDQVHENYDFVHATNYWTSWERKVTMRPAAMEAILSKELRYIGSKYPICSMIRVRKFVGRGWTINAGQFVKMAWQVSELDLTNIEVLKDQLVGVDSTYFMQMISELKEKDSSSVEGTYLMTLIDKLF